MTYCDICDQACKVDHQSAKNCRFYVFAPSGITYCNKIFISTTEFNGLSHAAYGNRIPHSEWKILVTMQLNVIYTHMINLRRPGHKFLHDTCYEKSYIIYLGIPISKHIAIYNYTPIDSFHRSSYRHRSQDTREKPPRFYNFSIRIRFLPYKSILLSLCGPPYLSAFLRSMVQSHMWSMIQ